jgi:hypothetical protein
MTDSVTLEYIKNTNIEELNNNKWKIDFTSIKSALEIGIPENNPIVQDAFNAILKDINKPVIKREVIIEQCNPSTIRSPSPSPSPQSPPSSPSTTTTTTPNNNDNNDNNQQQQPTTTSDENYDDEFDDDKFEDEDEKFEDDKYKDNKFENENQTGGAIGGAISSCFYLILIVVLLMILVYIIYKIHIHQGTNYCKPDKGVKRY